MQPGQPTTGVRSIEGISAQGSRVISSPGLGVLPPPPVATPPIKITPAAAAKPAPHKSRFSLWLRVILGVFVLALAASLLYLLVRPQTRTSQLQAGDFNNTSVPLGQFSAGTFPLSGQSLQVNGRLQVSDSLLLTPHSRPAQAATGQLYFDNDSKQLTYYNGQDFVSVGGNTNTTAVATAQAVTTTVNPTIPSSVLLQAVSPGTLQSGNFNVSGIGAVGALKTTVIDSSGQSLFVNPLTVNTQPQPGGASASLGSTTIGSAQEGPGWNGELMATKVTAGNQGGTLKSISVNFVGGSSSSHVQLAIYSDDGDIPSKPAGLLAASAIANLTPNGITTLTVPSVNLSANTSYWLAVNTDDTTALRTYNGGATGSSCFISSSFGFMPDPFSPPGCFYGSRVYTIYGTYITSASSGGAGGTAQLSLSSTGETTFQNSEDSATAFRVQNAAGSTTVLNIDTLNDRVAIGKASASYKLDIAGGDINLSNGRSLRFGGLQALSENGSGMNTTISNFISGGTVSAVADNFVVEDSSGAHQSLAVNSTGEVTFSNRVNSATAFLIQNSAGASFFIADSSTKKITVNGTDAAYATLRLNDTHFGSQQTTAPVIATPTNCGTSPVAAVTTGSTDTAGSFTITTGSGGTASTCDSLVTFHSPYGAAPKSILIVGKGTAPSANRQPYVSASTANDFTVSFGTSAGGANGAVYTFSYWVIE